MPQIEVTFDIDANGIVHVSAKDLGTGKQQQIRITASSGLSEDEIQRMVRDAESHKSDDTAKKELADLKNNAEGLIYTTEKSLEEYSSALKPEDLAEIRADLEALKGILHGNDAGQPSRRRSPAWRAPPTGSPTPSTPSKVAAGRALAGAPAAMAPGRRWSCQGVSLRYIAPGRGLSSAKSSGSRWKSATTTKCSAWPATRTRRPSRPPTASWRTSTTPTRTRAPRTTEEKFKEASEAYSVLSDPEKRARYDRFGHLNGQGGEDFPFGAGNINDIFGDIFGEMFGGQRGRGRAQARGADLRYHVEIGFEEAAFGTVGPHHHPARPPLRALPRHRRQARHRPPRLPHLRRLAARSGSPRASSPSPAPATTAAAPAASSWTAAPPATAPAPCASRRASR